MANQTGYLDVCIAARELRCKTVQAKCLLLYYAVNAGAENKFFKSYTDTALDTGISESTIKRINKKFADCGLLTYTEPTIGSGKSTVYQLHLQAMQKAVKSCQEAKDKKKDLAKQYAKERQQRWRDAHPKVERKALISTLKTALASASV